MCSIFYAELVYILLLFNTDICHLVLLLHSMGWRPLLSNASMTIRLHSKRSCAMMLCVCTSVRHHSLMSCIHFLLGLPLLFTPSIIPNITFFTNRLSSILQRCPNNLSFLSFASHSFDVKPLSYLYNRYFLLPVYVKNSPVTFHFKCHQRVYVSLLQHPGLTCILKHTHNLIMLSFVHMLMCSILS